MEFQPPMGSRYATHISTGPGNSGGPVDLAAEIARDTLSSLQGWVKQAGD